MENCSEISYVGDKNEKLYIPKKPYISISKAEVERVVLNEGYLGQKTLTLKLSDPARIKINALLMNDPSIPLLFVHDHQVLFSLVPGKPMENGEITAKPPHVGYDLGESLNSVSWLKKLSEAKK